LFRSAGPSRIPPLPFNFFSCYLCPTPFRCFLHRGPRPHYCRVIPPCSAWQILPAPCHLLLFVTWLGFFRARPRRLFPSQAFLFLLSRPAFFLSFVSSPLVCFDPFRPKYQTFAEAAARLSAWLHVEIFWSDDINERGGTFTVLSLMLGFLFFFFFFPSVFLPQPHSEKARVLPQTINASFILDTNSLDYRPFFIPYPVFDVCSPVLRRYSVEFWILSR